MIQYVLNQIFLKNTKKGNCEIMLTEIPVYPCLPKSLNPFLIFSNNVKKINQVG